MKTYEIIYVATVKMVTYVEAETEEKARKDFDEGLTEEGHCVDCQDVELVKIKEAM